MTHRTLVTFGYGSEVLIDTKDLPRLLEILEGEKVIDRGYINDEDGDLKCHHYIKDEGFSVRYSPAPRAPYLTEEQFFLLKEESDERSRQHNEEASSDEAA